MWEVEALARGTADAGNRKKYGAQENSRANLTTFTQNT
jgi:hypothetical protein